MQWVPPPQLQRTKLCEAGTTSAHLLQFKCVTRQQTTKGQRGHTRNHTTSPFFYLLHKRFSFSFFFCLFFCFFLFFLPRTARTRPILIPLSPPTLSLSYLQMKNLQTAEPSFFLVSSNFLFQKPKTAIGTNPKPKPVKQCPTCFCSSSLSPWQVRLLSALKRPRSSSTRPGSSLRPRRRRRAGCTPSMQSATPPRGHGLGWPTWCIHPRSPYARAVRHLLSQQ